MDIQIIAQVHSQLAGSLNLLRGIFIYKIMVETILKRKYDFKRNLVTGRILYKLKTDKEFAILEDTSFNSILRKLEKKGYKTTPAKLDILLNSDFTESFDPFTDYFEKLPIWNGETDFIEQLAQTIDTTDNEYFKWQFKKWIVAVVACALTESATNQAVLILCGGQNIGKTTWFRKLVPEKLKAYFYEGSIIPGDKDSKYYLAEKLIINMDEMVSFGKSQNEFYKSLITLDFVEQRRPYGRFSTRLMRRASFVGSTNLTEILTDMTGNRRYLCNDVITVDKDHLVNIDMVYAQAYSLFKSGFQFYFDSDDVAKVEDHNKSHLQVPEEYEIIESLFSLPDGDGETEFMSATEVLNLIRATGKNKSFSVEQIGKALTVFGYKKRTKQRKYELVIKSKLRVAS
jgi:predicted P-loop ATPase